MAVVCRWTSMLSMVATGTPAKGLAATLRATTRPVGSTGPDAPGRGVLHDDDARRKR